MDVTCCYSNTAPTLMSVTTSCVAQGTPILLHTNCHFSTRHHPEALQVLGERCQLPQLIGFAAAEGFVRHCVTL